MKLLNNKLFIKFANGGALKTEYDIGDGQTLYISGEERPEWWSNVIGVVEESGIDGIKKGDTIAVSYQVVFSYRYVGETRLYNNEITLPDGRDVFIVDKAHVLAIKKGDEYEAFGDWCLLKFEEKKDIVTSGGVIVPFDDSSKWNEAEFVSGAVDCDKGQLVMYEKCYHSEYEFEWKNKYVVLNKDYLNVKKTSKGLEIVNFKTQ